MQCGGKESEGVTRNQAEDLIAKLRTDARHGRLNLPQGRKLIFGFSQAAEKYLNKLKEEGGKLGLTQSKSYATPCGTPQLLTWYKPALIYQLCREYQGIKLCKW